MRATDLEQVRAIAIASPESPQWQPSDYAAYLSPENSTYNPALLRTALVAVAPNPNTRTPEEKILAFAAATLLLDGAQNLCQLDSIAVRPETRRQGLGAALLHTVLHWAAQNSARHFSLEVRAGNAPAIRLYQRLGLRPEGRRPSYYTHPEEDALILGTPVTAGTPRTQIGTVFHHENH
jgi:ribosomal-protein-alanine N-acetyltransferase